MRLHVDRLTRSFGPRRIFGPLSFEVLPGRVLGIAGQNGSGKTTLLKTLAGLIRPSSGTVSLVTASGAGDSRVTPREAPRLLGWVAPDLSLYAELTAAENLSFFARLTGARHENEDLSARLTAVGLDPLRVAGAPAGTLSTGQRQRLKLAFATQHQPGLLLLDEPGSNLDEAGHGVVASVVALQRGRGITVIASNDPRDLALTDERVAL
jgi:heme exporter protein A